VELGVDFSSDISGYITGIRFYKSSANTGTHTGSLWTSSGTLLATATFTNETASGWQQVNFSNPVQITAGTIYVASYHTNVGHESDDIGTFAGQSINNGPLHALEDESGSRDGVYVYGSGGVFPSNISPSSDNYYVDVVFATSANLPPTVTSETPAPNAEGVATNTTVTATFSESVLASSITTSDFVLIDPNNNTVPATVSYNDTGHIATLTPSAPLNAATTYTVMLSGATTGSGNTMSPVSWSFSTAGLYNIWGNSATPNTPDAGPDSPVELGVKFTSDVSGYITGIRFYKSSANTGTHVGDLWTASGTLLESATFTNETASGWQQVNFATPVAIAANTVYVASYHTTVGHYAADANYFATAGYDNAPLHALEDGVSGGDGVYGYGAAGTFPTGSYQSDNYWVDVALSTNTNQATHLNVSAPTPATAGNAFNVTVTAQNAGNQTVTGYTGTVHFSSSDVQAGLPANYTFTAADNGTHTFSVTLKTAGSQTVTATDTVTSSITGSATVAVSPAAASTLVVTAPTSATAGAAFSVTVTAKDLYGNTATGYLGTVQFTSSDSQTGVILPANYNFTAADAGVHTFTNGVTLETAGSQTVTATDTGTSSITGKATVTVASAAQVTHLNVSAPTSATAGTAFNITVTAQNASNGTVTGYTGTVHFTSSDSQVAGLPANYAFTTADNGVHIFTGLILKTAGSQTVTATDTVTSSITGSATVTVSPAAASTLVVTAPTSATTGAPFSVTVTAKDPYNNIATGYLGTVHFTSSGTGTVLPANYTFTAADKGAHTFTNGVTLWTVGSQTVTATDTGTSSITGKATVTVGTASLWSSSTTPTTPDSGPDSAVTLGVKFTASFPNGNKGYITGIRFYKSSANTGTHVGSLWSSTGTLLATATFTNETASGWQQVNFSSPVAITAGTTYVASYFVPNGHYADDKNYFTSSYSNGPLTALANGGVYAYGSKSTFPTSAWESSNYYVDVVFSDPSAKGKVSAVVAAPTATATTTPKVVTPRTTTATTPSSKNSDPSLAKDLSSSGSVSAGSTFLSTVLDNGQNGQAATWDKLFVPQADLPSGVNLVVQVRTGNTKTPDSTWSAWTAVSNGQPVPNAGARYLQYQVSLNIPSGQTVHLPVSFEIDVTSVANTDAHAPNKNDQVASLPQVSAPVLGGISAPVNVGNVGNSGVSPTGGLVSADVYNAGQGKTWQSLSWTAASLPSGATLIVEVSTGNTTTPNDGTWSPWTAVANGADILVPGRYLRYRVMVLTANSSLTTTVPLKISLVSDPLGTVTPAHFPGSSLPRPVDDGPAGDGSLGRAE
ncbi:MAG: DUF4082 domain-containing protein, partial [Isosphaeraceae bacterium]